MDLLWDLRKFFMNHEPFTNDGDVFDPLVDGNLHSVLGKDTAIIRAVDGLQFNGRNTL